MPHFLQREVALNRFIFYAFLCAFLPFAEQAAAADAFFYISGGVKSVTCQIGGSAQGSSVPAVPIYLGFVSPATLATKGKFGGTIQVNSSGALVLTGCAANAAIALTLDSTGPFDIINNAYDNLIPVGNGGAQNLQVQIMNPLTQTVLSPSASNSITVLADANGVAFIPVGARYYSNGTVSGGLFLSKIGFNITYP